MATKPIKIVDKNEAIDNNNEPPKSDEKQIIETPVLKEHEISKPEENKNNVQNRCLRNRQKSFRSST